VFLCSLAFADEDQGVSIYFHPGSLLWPALYLTIEYPLSEYNSIIINPSLLLFSRNFGMFSFFDQSFSHPYTEVFSLGSGIGIRNYGIGYIIDSSGKNISEWLYLQFMTSAYYIKIREYYDKRNYGTYSGPMIDIIFYLGCKDKFYTGSFFMDFGLGYRWASVEPEPYRAFGESGEYLDVNIGFGFSF
jgi:hypothetical protein